MSYLGIEYNKSVPSIQGIYTNYIRNWQITLWYFSFNVFLHYLSFISTQTTRNIVSHVGIHVQWIFLTFVYNIQDIHTNLQGTCESYIRVLYFFSCMIANKITRNITWGTYTHVKLIFLTDTHIVQIISTKCRKHLY